MSFSLKYCILVDKGADNMTKYILSVRPFREEFQQKMKGIDPDYQFVTADGLNEADVWNNVEITIGWRKDWNEKLLFEGTPLKWVHSISAGVDYLPLTKFKNYGIQLTNSSGLHAQSIADHLLAIIFMQSRGIFTAIQNQLTATWDKNADYSYLYDLRVLIVGTGKIGQKLASYLDVFGCKPVGINTNERSIEHFTETYPLSELNQQASFSDIVINILPLTEDTYHLYNTEFFNSMKTTGTFINVGRGSSVDTGDLYAALKNKDINFAAIDVFEEEPLPSDNELWSLKNILITPHISGYTPHFQKKFMQIFLDDLSSFVNEGKLVENEVSLNSGY